MSKNVFANGRGISAIADDNKSSAAMPDVCLSPPSPPAGPVPIPYPNFSDSSDTSNGTRTVRIGGKEVGQKNKSFYKKSRGDEAATRTLGMGVVTHTLQGKTYHVAWSMDVQVEGKNVIRHMDLTTHNHASSVMNSGSTTVDKEQMAPASADPECQELDQANTDTRNNLNSATRDKTIVGPNGNGKGTTVSSAKFTPKGGGAPSINSAHSRQKAYEKCTENLVKGGDMGDRKNGKSNLCADANHTHAKPSAQKSGHTEARIFDDLGGAQPGTITFNIDWRSKTNPASKMPCPDCHKMMCAARACDLKISLCNKDNEKKELTDEHCPANPATYLALQKTMG